MRLVHVIHGLEIRSGGSHRACAELCETLASLGHDVSLYHVQNTREECFSPRGVDVRAFPSSVFRRYAYSPALRRCLEEEIPKTDVVHLHASWRYPSLPAARIARQHGVPYVVQPHGNFHPWKLSHKGWRKWIYGQLIEKRILRGAAFIHVESQEDAQDVQAYVPGVRTVLSPCGAFADAFDDRGPPDYLADRWPVLAGKTCILYLARIDVNKGVDRLVDAFGRVAAKHRHAALLVIGPDYAGLTPHLQARCASLGIADRVVWGGMVSENERIWILNQSDFYVLPSLSENFGISVLEAMFCAKPVITTTATPWAELETARAGLVVPPEVEPLRGALQTLLEQTPEQRAQMGSNARALALQKYEWKAVASQLIDAYEHVRTRFRQSCANPDGTSAPDPRTSSRTRSAA